jgi:hypothetical protein
MVGIVEANANNLAGPRNRWPEADRTFNDRQRRGIDRRDPGETLG